MNENNPGGLFESKVDEDKKIYVRVSTSYYYSRDALNCLKRISLLKRRSSKEAQYWFSEENAMAGSDGLFKSIININKVEDGIYTLDICNISKDWETGYLDSWDWVLTPVEQESTAPTK